jgi:hypothetical protein
MLVMLIVSFATLVAIVLFEGVEPGWVRASAGDAVVVLPVYAVAAIVFARRRPWQIAVGVLALAWLVEFSQRYHAPWIDRVRATFVGRMTLGSSFSVSDLWCYAIGVAVAWFIDMLATRCSTLRRQQS